MITDTGNHQCWVEQYWDVYEPRAMFTPGGFAGMGFGTYGVLGVKLARPDRPAVCVTSDGSWMMFPGAVATAVEHDIPVVWVLLNNYTIGVIRDLQRFYMDGREIGTSFMKHSTGEFWNPDFAKMAEAMGAGAHHGRARRATSRRRSRRRSRPGSRTSSTSRSTATRRCPLIGTWQFAPDPAGRADVRAAGTRSERDRLFPFTAIVGQERLKRALLLNAVNPAVGGVLVKGPSGTAKSTAVRGLAELLPEIEVVADCPFSCDPARPCTACADAPRARRGAAGRRGGGGRIVDLPLNATEDRVAGPSTSPGRCARARRRSSRGCSRRRTAGILYVDEINLLDDHLTDVLLDAAALGVNVVEREGVSVAHPARFLLVGTMNPEEGELRPQLADRLGLQVEVEPADGRASAGRGAAPPRGLHGGPGGRSPPPGRTSRARSPSACVPAEALLAEVAVPERLYVGDRRARAAGRHRQPSRRHHGPRVREGGGGARRAQPRCARATSSTPRELALGHRLAVDPFAPAPSVTRTDIERGCSTRSSTSGSKKKSAPPGEGGPGRSLELIEGTPAVAELDADTALVFARDLPRDRLERAALRASGVRSLVVEPPPRQVRRGPAS